MQLEAKKYLFDVQQAVLRLIEFTQGKSLDDYRQDVLLRSAVERQFEIIGEALNQLSKIDLHAADRITDYRRIIAFRNILIHGYAEIDDRIVWGVVEGQLSQLKRDVNALLTDSPDD